MVALWEPMRADRSADLTEHSKVETMVQSLADHWEGMTAGHWDWSWAVHWVEMRGLRLAGWKGVPTVEQRG